MKRIEPTDEEAAGMAAALEHGVDYCGALLRELTAVAPENVIPPRYLSWRLLEQGGLLIITDRAQFIVGAEALEAFGPVLARMVRRELICGIPEGNC